MFETIEGIPIPVPCPRCHGKMIAVKYDTSLKILRERSWQICKNVSLKEVQMISKSCY